MLFNSDVYTKGGPGGPGHPFCGLLNISASHVQCGIQSFAKFKRLECTRLHLRELQPQKFFPRSMHPKLPRKVAPFTVLITTIAPIWPLYTMYTISLLYLPSAHSIGARFAQVKVPVKPHLIRNTSVGLGGGIFMLCAMYTLCEIKIVRKFQHNFKCVSKSLNEKQFNQLYDSVPLQLSQIIFSK